jgi:pimeloyl-ACP methyl ester carboxylesterase
MKLFYRKFGQGSVPVFILPGLFGQCDNWQTIAKGLAEKNKEVYFVDQRNHGLSPHSEIFNYKVMSSDLYELISGLGFNKVILIGHSMGGKTAMQFVVDYTEMIASLIIADISPRYYPPHHQEIIRALQSVDLKIIKTRKEAELILSGLIPDSGTRQFLLKNLFWETDTRLNWRFNLKAIAANMEEVGKEINFSQTYTNQNFSALFLRGENSAYINETDLHLIHKTFPDARIETIPAAGHWLHADNPKSFLEAVLDFIPT